MHQPKQYTNLENIFRHEYGKITSILVHKFGPNNIEKIEDVVQDAFLKAMQVWAYKEVPKNPTAWLLQVANNKFIDSFRRSKKIQQQDDISIFAKDASSQQKEIALHNRIQDSQLKMIFACCNPSLSTESQIILSLKLIGGFSNKEISRALLKKEDAVAKAFTRAKKKFQEKIKTLDIPIEMGLTSRIHAVLKVIYLLFTEGYTASSGVAMIKRDICYEAIRLALLLTENESTNVSEAHALISLMCFHTSRFNARVDEEGDLVDLEHQDRSKYDVDLIRNGMQHFRIAKNKSSQNPSYFLQAAISYQYCEASTFEEIDWEHILEIYDIQLKYFFSPIIRLNRIIPYYKVHGAEKGLSILKEIVADSEFKDHALYHSIKAQLEEELQQYKEAKKSLKSAIDLTQNEFQKRHLKKKLKAFK